MEQILVALLVGVAFVVFAAAVVFSASRLKAEVPEEDREFLDPLPRTLRMMWPLVRFVDYHLAQRIPDRLVAGPAEALRLSGLLYLMSPRQFISLCVISLLGFAGITGILLSAVDLFSWLYVLIAAAFGYVYPRIWLSDSLKTRQKNIVRALPTYLDFLTMGVEAGLNMAGAISQAVAKGPAGPMKSELSLVLRDLRSGLTRSEALRRMDERVRVPQVSSFVSAVVQAERMGASLGATFRFQAEQRRTERFQRAEKLAMEAPVKLIFPLVVFIFPVTFVVLMFPIAVKFMQSGVTI
ncbi:MAG: type II secretion system F family protein [Roseateles sp.]|uniref:type II secretion system F family protein n=1 Tax=Roseateles sp. TaxID=1971397 RepID=UPI0039EC9054